MTCQLYRHFDAQGRLLYVGISLSAAARLSQHKDKPWAGDIANVTVETFPSREDALEAEKSAIKAENPLHNVVHNRSRATGGIPRFPDRFDRSYLDEMSFPVLAMAVTDSEEDCLLVEFDSEGSIEIRSEGFAYISLLPHQMEELAEAGREAVRWYDRLKSTKAGIRILNGEDAA